MGNLSIDDLLAMSKVDDDVAKIVAEVTPKKTQSKPRTKKTTEEIEEEHRHFWQNAKGEYPTGFEDPIDYDDFYHINDVTSVSKQQLTPNKQEEYGFFKRTGNAFSTFDTAFHMGKAVSLFLVAHRFSMLNGGDKIDFDDIEQPKYYVVIRDGEFVIRPEFNDQQPFTPYFISEEVAERFIKVYSFRLKDVVAGLYKKLLSLNEKRETKDV